jgi:hypothetical protein
VTLSEDIEPLPVVVYVEFERRSGDRVKEKNTELQDP